MVDLHPLGNRLPNLAQEEVGGEAGAQEVRLACGESYGLFCF